MKNKNMLEDDSIQLVMGFEFDKEVANKIRQNDIALRILAKLQEIGVCLVSYSSYCSCPELAYGEDEYWEVGKFEGKERLILVSTRSSKIVDPVYEG